MNLNGAFIIGCGRMGARHVQAAMGLGMPILGIYDINTQNVFNTCNSLGLPESTLVKNIDDIYSMASNSMVVVATTAPSHEEYVIKLIESGCKKILCEKPASTSIESCYRMIAKSKQHSADVAVNHQMQYLEQYTIPKQMLNSDEFGGIQSINVSAGNFGMSMNGVHYLEMMRYMFDEPAHMVSAWFDEVELANPRGAEFKDKSGTLRAVTKTGKRFYLDASATNGHGVLVTYVAKYGQIVVDELTGSMYYTRRNESEREHPTTRYGMPHEYKTTQIKGVDIIESTQRVMKDLVAGKNFPSLENATMAISAIVAGYASNDNQNCQFEISDTNQFASKVFPWA